MKSILLFTAFMGWALTTSATTFEVKGTTTNTSVKNKDGLVDFSLIIPGMSQEQIVNFDLGRVISPANDQIKVASYTIDLPSNLSLPQQTESYFISVNLNKPEFRFYVESEDTYEVYALYGRFPLNEMVKGFQNDKSIFELVEYFDFLSGGMDTVQVKSNVTGLAIPVNEFNFTGEHSVKAPTYSQDKIMISFSLFKENNLFFPTDIKKVASAKTVALVQKETGDHWNLSLMMNSTRSSFRDTFDGNILSGVFGGYAAAKDSPLTQVSYTLAPASATVTPQFLSMIAVPTFDKTKWTVKASAPATISGVMAYATTLTLSEVTVGGSENFPIDFKKTVWSTEVSGWVNDFQIPNEAKNLIVAGKTYSWDTAYLGSSAGASTTQIDWTQVSHVTRNAVKF